MAKKRRETSTNVIAMPATESSTPALDKATGLTDRDIARREFEIFCERDASMATTLTTGCKRNEN